ncbi:hypothetical protein FZC78_11710 [Rossellomorea vietnamensis]|uniref:DUF3784 domain-containing protein n=1 Tax=Rossellomorea vietnamensis TaxID=218284 RepID=A0A5D4NRY6_9BACI|nr:hypothetical protein [Rossellomorea vietnamensis]TYS16649.1 hypothetical protein FZC78_11710 [Rossellomorea vietnamensis]
MDYGLLVIGIAFLVVSYLIGVKKQTKLLVGFNKKMIKNKSLLGTVTGLGYFLPLGVIVVFNSMVDYSHEGTVFMGAMLLLLTALYFFINKKLLD